MKVLVVIDNLVQYERVKLLIKEKNRKDVTFDFRHSNVKSDIWNHPDFLNKEQSIVDVNEKADEIIRMYDLVISVHCFQFFPEILVKGVRCINIHPGYNPINRGWYPQVFAIIHDLRIGATIHEMDVKLDNGPIICRDFVDKFISDTSLSIYNRVLEKEMELFSQYYDQILDNNYKRVSPEDSYNYFTKGDFNQLKEINLEERGSFLDFYNRLRALTHGNYRNAYIIDKTNGRRIYISLNVDSDDQ